MKKYFDLLFLLLPPIVSLIIIIILSGGQDVDAASFFQMIIYGTCLSFVGAPCIVFNKSIANWSAKMHSIWHPVIYEEDETSVTDDTNEEKSQRSTPNFRPTQFSYQMSFFGGIGTYALGLLILVVEIGILR